MMPSKNVNKLNLPSVRTTIHWMPSPKDLWLSGTHLQSSIQCSDTERHCDSFFFIDSLTITRSVSAIPGDRICFVCSYASRFALTARWWCSLSPAVTFSDRSGLQISVTSFNKDSAGWFPGRGLWTPKEVMMTSIPLNDMFPFYCSTYLSRNGMFFRHKVISSYNILIIKLTQKLCSHCGLDIHY